MPEVTTGSRGYKQAQVKRVSEYLGHCIFNNIKILKILVRLDLVKY